MTKSVRSWKRATAKLGLDRWIHNYVTSDPNPPSDVRARYPLAEARVEVKEIPGKPGSYNAVAWMRPWLQMEELTTSMRMVAKYSEAWL